MREAIYKLMQWLQMIENLPYSRSDIANLSPDFLKRLVTPSLASFADRKRKHAASIIERRAASNAIKKLAEIKSKKQLEDKYSAEYRRYEGLFLYYVKSEEVKHLVNQTIHSILDQRGETPDKIGFIDK